MCNRQRIRGGTKEFTRLHRINAIWREEIAESEWRYGILRTSVCIGVAGAFLNQPLSLACQNTHRALHYDPSTSILFQIYVSIE